MDYPVFIDNLLTLFGTYGFMLVILFGILHPLTENPWSFITLSLGFTLIGFPYGLFVVLLSNLIGVLLLYLIVNIINEKSDHYLKKKKVSSKILTWFTETERWRHIVVIGMPLVPTYPVKVALPFSDITMKSYVTTMMLSYGFLYAIYSLAYFGLVGFITNNIPNYLSFILILIFSLYIYFGKSLYMWLLHRKKTV